MALLTPVEEVLVAHLQLAALLVHFRQPGEPIGLGVRQRIEQDGLEDAF